MRSQTIGRRHGTRQYQRGVEIRRNVLLVPVETLALAFATVPHLRILDRDPAIFGNASNDPDAPLLVLLRVLSQHLFHGLHVGRDDVMLCQLHAIEPVVQRTKLSHEVHKGIAALLRNTPVTVERSLRAAAESERNACLLRDGLDWELGQLR